MANEDGNGTVRFQVKDLLTKIDVKLEKIDTKLDMKADRSRVHELAADMAALRLRRSCLRRWTGWSRWRRGVTGWLERSLCCRWWCCRSLLKWPATIFSTKGVV
jgi:hypothetical protein